MANSYLLRFAEEDGTPDEGGQIMILAYSHSGHLYLTEKNIHIDIPALVRTQEIGHFRGAMTFSLCRVAEFKGKTCPGLV